MVLDEFVDTILCLARTAEGSCDEQSEECRRAKDRQEGLRFECLAPSMERDQQTGQQRKRRLVAR